MNAVWKAVQPKALLEAGARLFGAWVRDEVRWFAKEDRTRRLFLKLDPI